jgi:hypothetical protein
MPYAPLRGGFSMIPAKEEVKRILDQLPNDVTLEDIQYHIYIRQKIDRGLDEIEAGNTFTEEEFDKRMARWLES